MKTLMLSLLMLTGVPAGMVWGGHGHHESAECDSCGGKCHGHHAHGPHGGVMGMMPQTGYNPPYGCYPGTARHTNRYPAFHGNFYSKAYNYRNYFDYPHHAGLHEPTSHFSYHTEQETSSPYREQAPAPVMESEPAPIVPPAPKPTAGWSGGQFSGKQALSMASTEQANFAPVVRATETRSNIEANEPTGAGYPLRSLRR
jgi:hypothetical protein